MANKILIGLGIVALSLITSIAVVEMNKPKTEQSLGSVNQANEYHATTTSYLAVPTGAVKEGYGALGSVVITGAGAGLIEIFDATTTNSGLRAASMTTTSIQMVSIPESTAAGTYTFDMIFKNGLIITTQTVRPTSTITWR
jgi:hypothetical protein